MKLALSAAMLALAVSATALAGVRLSGDEALQLAFPGCTIKRDTVFLTAKQQARAADLAGVEVPSALVHRYSATCDGAPGGVAFFDKHRVRTLPERLMVALDAKGKVRRIEVLTFDEPTDYLPRASWYSQFIGRGLDDDMRLSGVVRPIAGATMTARSTMAAVRRVLALDRVLHEAAAGAASDEAAP